MRNRVHGIEEATTNYYYDVIDICRVVDPAMAETTKVYYFLGIMSLVGKKIVPVTTKNRRRIFEGGETVY